MANVILPGQTFQRPGQIWDHTVVAAGSSPLSNVPLYSVGIGGTGYGVTTKTKYDCNLQSGNRQNPGEAFVATQLGFRFNPNMKLSDIFAILNQYYFEFSIQSQGNIFADGLLWLYPAGGGMAGVSTNTNESVWDIGIPSILTARVWGTQDGFNITDQMFFGVNVKTDTAVPTMNANGNGLDLWVVLDGLKSKVVTGA